MRWINSLLMSAFLVVVAAIPARAGDVAPITVEAPMKPVGTPSAPASVNPVCQASAEDYWLRYPDVATLWQPHSYDGAYLHYTLNGIKEGRTWNGTLCAPPGAASTTPVALPNGSPLILGGCAWMPSNGTNCVLFPNGATLGGFTFQSVVKTGQSEVLSALKISVPGLSDREVIRVHHLGISNPPPTAVLFPEALVLPPGSTVWCYADGWGTAHVAGFECQATLYLHGNPAWTSQ